MDMDSAKSVVTADEDAAGEGAAGGGGDTAGDAKTLSVMERLRRAGQERARREGRDGDDAGDVGGEKKKPSLKSVVSSALKDGGPLADRLRMLKKAQRVEMEAKENLEKKVAERERLLALAERRANEAEEKAARVDDIKKERDVLAAAVKVVERELAIAIDIAGSPAAEGGDVSNRRQRSTAVAAAGRVDPVASAFPSSGRIQKTSSSSSSSSSSSPTKPPRSQSSKPQTPESSHSAELRTQALVSTIRALKEGRAALEESVRRREEQEKARISESRTAEGERRKVHDDYAARLEALRDERDVARGAVELSLIHI